MEKAEISRKFKYQKMKCVIWTLKTEMLRKLKYNNAQILEIIVHC